MVDGLHVDAHQLHNRLLPETIPLGVRPVKFPDFLIIKNASTNMVGDVVITLDDVIAVGFQLFQYGITLAAQILGAFRLGILPRQVADEVIDAIVPTELDQVSVDVLDEIARIGQVVIVVNEAREDFCRHAILSHHHDSIELDQIQVIQVRK